jgi:hypothetical protein
MLYPAELRAHGKRTILLYSPRGRGPQVGLRLRNPFVWRAQIQRELLDEELSRLRDVPYSTWQKVVAAPIRKTLTARDGKAYTLEVTARPLHRDDILVTLSLATRGLIRRGLMRQTFTITSDNRFVV